MVAMILLFMVVIGAFLIFLALSPMAEQKQINSGLFVFGIILAMIGIVLVALLERFQV